MGSFVFHVMEEKSKNYFLSGLIRCLSVNPGEKKGLKEETISFSVGSHLKNTTVKIVHAGGRIELYQHPFPASELIQRYPGMCIAQPDIFKRPHESVLSAEDMLLPGNKYIIIRSTTVEKLKRRHTRKGNVNQQADSDEPILDFKEIKDVGDNYSEESFVLRKTFISLKRVGQIVF